MADLRQAAQQMLEAIDSDHPDVQMRAAVALRAALAQEEPEPVAWIHRKHYLLGHAENMPPADKALAQGWEPLYAHPPRREWQGLTEEEIQSIHDTYHKRMGPQEFARAIDQALRSKNG